MGPEVSLESTHAEESRSQAQQARSLTKLDTRRKGGLYIKLTEPCSLREIPAAVRNCRTSGPLGRNRREHLEGTTAEKLVGSQPGVGGNESAIRQELVKLELLLLI